jgi:hypothetical protein
MDDVQVREARALERIDRATHGALAWVVLLGVLGAFRVASERPWNPDATLQWALLVPPVLLAWGVARRSRVAALLLLCYIGYWYGSMLAQSGSWLAGGLLLLFGGAALSGVLGTWEWHRIQRQRATLT